MDEHAFPTNNLNPTLDSRPSPSPNSIVDPTKEVPDTSGQIFDISGDTISLVKEGAETVAKPTVPDETFGTVAAAWRSPIVDTRTTPPNPMPKTVGFGQMNGFGQAPVEQKQNLQDAISGVLPTLQSRSLPPTLAHDDSSEHLLKRLRTYESDIAEVMSRNKFSSSTIAIAESKKQTGRETLSNTTEPVSTSHTGRAIFMILLSIILIGGGAIGAYYLYSISPLAPVQTTTTPEIRSSIIPSNSRSAITIDSESPTVIQSRIQAEINKSQPASTIREIIFVPADAATTRDQVGAKDMLITMDITAPDILTRSLAQEWMLGIYADAEGTKSVFVVTTTNFFQNAFAGMLQWENVMPDELRLYLLPHIKGIATVPLSSNTPPLLANASTTNKTQPVASSTSSTPTNTQLAPAYQTIRGHFEDKIIKNKDIRAFRTEQGQTLFIYSFIDSKHLVITDKEATLAEILSRIEKQSFVR